MDRVNPDPQDIDDELDYATLDELRGDDDDYDGPLDHPCPLCGPGRSTEYNRNRATLRTWRMTPIIISFYCARCEVKGAVEATMEELLNPQPKPRGKRTPPIKPRTTGGNLFYVERLWAAATDHPVIKGYFRWRGISLHDVPKGVLRYHPQCPWWKKKVPCILARYSDAVTGELRGLWRRSADGLHTPMTLGPMGGCVIRLFPEVGKRLVIGEGIETTLAAATRVTHRGKLLRPAWATGSAGNMRRFPVLDAVEQLIILVDNDESGTGQQAAEECARRWVDAGREVIRLIPRQVGADFNDLVRNHEKQKRHD